MFVGQELNSCDCVITSKAQAHVDLLRSRASVLYMSSLKRATHFNIWIDRSINRLLNTV